MSDIEWKDGAIESTVSMGPWFVRATSGDWAVYLDGVGKVRSGMRDSRAENKAAITAALAELRVSTVVAPVDAEIACFDSAIAVLREEHAKVSKSLASSGDRRDWDGSNRDAQTLENIESMIARLERARAAR